VRPRGVWGREWGISGTLTLRLPEFMDAGRLGEFDVEVTVRYDLTIKSRGWFAWYW
jgi:hypothetical protein